VRNIQKPEIFVDSVLFLWEALLGRVGNFVE